MLLTALAATLLVRDVYLSKRAGATEDAGKLTKKLFPNVVPEAQVDTVRR
jgi:hypothetical protein